MSAPTGKELGVAYATAGEVYAAAVILPALGIISLAFRWYQRYRRRQGIGIDDWLMVPSLLFTIGMGIMLCIGVHGKAIGYPTPYEPNLTHEEKMYIVNPTIRLMGVVQFVVIFLLALASGFLKLSIICLYRRIFVSVLCGSIFDWITIAALVIVAAWMVTFVVATTLTCGVHVAVKWGNLADKNQYCGMDLDIGNAFVISDSVTNLLIWLMPMPMIWRLHMSWRRKLAAVGILMIGSISVIASIIKIVVGLEIAGGGLSADVDEDLTVSTILYWCMIEAGLANLASNLPLFRGLFKDTSLNGFFSIVRSSISLSSLRQSSNRDSKTEEQDSTRV
ncbi:conserved hypothetical protein [Talaromyces stipitatus ATCC 10500]|uniref:Rhodopsin domain-containing protein n=2 Tax=Talaromyces stipitatus (strain ATCC 10500 / CBS 375.48 / QM 6759 / NRRL 1006) TaxID=441959 RepID=B8MQ41_TALSN|nr:uncharacterized protein TSTA_055690 [Talaromyces stipitatus ATCC 10500]EED13067.1 conserved hypothetical protein [Talaromyces stipitatus ATCC 10500]